MAKDPQKERLYKAERRAGIWETEKIGETTKQVQKFTTTLLKRKGVQKIIRNTDNKGARLLLANGVVIEGNNGCHATIKHAIPHIRLTKKGFRIGILVHELAHIITYQTDYAHDPAFAKVQLELSRNIIGKDYAERLQASFNLYRVKVLGATGKASVPRVPASQKQWHGEQKAKITERKSSRAVASKFKAEFIATLEAGDIWKCAVDGCDGEGLGEITDRPWDSYEKMLCYGFECPVCGNNEWFTVRRRIEKEPTMQEVWLANCG